jgi:hypothetical protein
MFVLFPELIYVTTRKKQRCEEDHSPCCLAVPHTVDPYTLTYAPSFVVTETKHSRKRTLHSVDQLSISRRMTSRLSLQAHKLLRLNKIGH